MVKTPIWQKGYEMRVYLVIVDDSEEAGTALRFAARRASKTDGIVHLLALVPPQPFQAFSAIQATIEEEARSRAEALANSAAASIAVAGGRTPAITLREGDPVKAIRAYLEDHPEVAALVLGAARDSAQGPLVTYFAGAGLGTLPCPLFLVPGGLSDAEIDRVS